MDEQGNTKNKQALSPAVAALMAFTLIGIGASGFWPLTSELKTGEVYTLAVMFGQGAKAHRDISPEAYWINIGWQVLGFAIGIVLGIGIIYKIYADHKKRAQYEKRRR